MLQDAVEQFGPMAPRGHDAMLADARDGPPQIVKGHQRVLQFTTYACSSGLIHPRFSVGTKVFAH